MEFHRKRTWMTGCIVSLRFAIAITVAIIAVAHTTSQLSPQNLEMIRDINTFNPTFDTQQQQSHSPLSTVHYSVVLLPKSAITRESAFGASATASTLKPSSSRRYASVVGPMAARRARRKLLSPNEGEDSRAAKEKCVRKAGMTCDADDGAKKTIHHGSHSSSSPSDQTTCRVPPCRSPGASAR